MEDAPMSVDRLVLAYRKIREAKQEKEEAHKEAIGELDEKLDRISAELLKMCSEQGVDSLRTPNGTVTRGVRTRYWTSDWESMYEFIKEHEAYSLLEQRINNKNMRQFIEENPDELPAGLNADTKYTITVRKPTAK